jgi:DNA adenine methylase
MKPFLKWAGNKYQIIERIKALLPPGNRLIEPFVGSGAVFLNTDYSEYCLSDNNSDLIYLYQYLQKEGLEFIDFCKTFFQAENNCKENYYELRAHFNESNDSRLRAALFLYFNKHGYNGLCRYNSKGGFNVPFGKYKSPYFPEKEMLYFYQKSLNAEFKVADFTETLNEAKKGDVIYCDPPYDPLSITSNFTSYSASGFGREQQEQLAKYAKKLSKKGIMVLISNHNTEFIQQAYEPAEILPFEVQRYISCDGTNRAKVGEVLALFG